MKNKNRKAWLRESSEAGQCLGAELRGRRPHWQCLLALLEVFWRSRRGSVVSSQQVAHM
jgi:hypothetical protein